MRPYLHHQEILLMIVTSEVVLIELEVILLEMKSLHQHQHRPKLQHLLLKKKISFLSQKTILMLI